MSTIQDGIRIPTCVFEAALWRNSVRVACSCGHAACFEPCGLWAVFNQRGWKDQFREMRPRFYCSRCKIIRRRKVRPKSVSWSDELPSITLPKPDEREWKRELSRFRA